MFSLAHHPDQLGQLAAREAVLAWRKKIWSSLASSNDCDHAQRVAQQVDVERLLEASLGPLAAPRGTRA